MLSLTYGERKTHGDGFLSSNRVLRRVCVCVVCVVCSKRRYHARRCSLLCDCWWPRPRRTWTCPSPPRSRIFYIRAFRVPPVRRPSRRALPPPRGAAKLFVRFFSRSTGDVVAFPRNIVLFFFCESIPRRRDDVVFPTVEQRVGWRRRGFAIKQRQWQIKT